MKKYLTILPIVLVFSALAIAQIGAPPSNGGIAMLGGSGSSVANLATATGNLAVSHLNSGTNASASTFWRGDGTWASASVANLDLSNNTTQIIAPAVAGWLSIVGINGTTPGTLFLGPTSSNGVQLTKGTDQDVTFATSTLELTNGAQNFVSNYSALGFRASTNGGLYLGAGTRPTIVGRLPTSLTGFGTSPALPSAPSGGSHAFLVDVGTGGTATSGTVNLVATSVGWVCHIQNITANAANRANQRVVQTSSTTTTVVVQNQLVSTGAAQAFTANDILAFLCGAY